MVTEHVKLTGKHLMDALEEMMTAREALTRSLLGSKS